jgi:hypothetical protein
MSLPTNDDIAAMNYKELQEACRSAGFSAGGPTCTLRQRLRGASIGTPNLDERASKRQKLASADLICAITHDLPFDPVTAEDGRVYDRHAIEQHIEEKTADQLKSPITNEKMGKRLFPAIQHKNLIQTLIDMEVITGDLADSWNKKAEEKKATEDLFKRAESGDSTAMVILGCRYAYGQMGFKKDKKLGFTWFKRAQNAGSVRGTAMTGIYLLKGIAGVAASSQQEGLVYLALAAERGSNFAAYELGMAKAKGKSGLLVNSKEALGWLQKCASPSCNYDHLTDSTKAKARQKL